MAITLTMFQGLPFKYEVTLQDEVGAAIDITGATIISKIRPTLESETVLAELSTANTYISITDGVNGKFLLDLPDTITSTIETNGVFDIKLTLPDTTVYLIAEGGKIKSKLFSSR